jgi:deoxyribodipyrimidine photo-lyase
MNTGLYWFTNDLRVQDNPNLTKAASEVDFLVCLYCYPKVSSYLAQYAQVSQFGVAKQQFLDESLLCLNSSLNTLNQ